jgi:acyl-CoA synthetase (AMP-forming)/AMP-acid ligase II
MAASLVDLVREREQAAPDALAYGFLADGEGEVSERTYAGLAAEARRIGSLLQDRVAPGGRALLVFEPGLQFVAAYYGCLFAGVAAVPAYPPAPPRLDAGIAHLGRVVRDAGIEAILTSGALGELAAALPGVPELLGDVPWLATDAPGAGDAAAWRDPGVRGRDLAMLQYTSGSTAEPKGVALRHENLLANMRAIDWFLGAPGDGAFVSWLPMYHDMGLIGTIIYPLYRGFPSHLLSPVHFLQTPVRWLRAITRFRATISGGPNFAYELCVRRVPEAQRAGLDLSSWEVAFNGAEPIQAGTVRRFEAAYGPSGLRQGTVVGCYGLAEASLLVAGDHRDGPGRFLRVDRDELAAHRVATRPDGTAGTVELVSSGRVPPGHAVRVVDPDTCEELPPARVGELWFHGPSAGAGYWRRPGESEAMFGAVPKGRPESERHLRTGDLGFVHDGDVYVTGRLKNLLVVRGRNVHPHDVEETAQRADGRLRAGRGVAFPVPTPDGEAVALVQETHVTEAAELGHLAREAQRAVLEELGVALAEVCLVPPQSVLRTSSGKLRRDATSLALRAGELTVLHVERAGDVAAGSGASPS